LDIVFELPILRDGVIIPHEEVVSALNRDTVSYSNSLGFGGQNFICGTFSPQLVFELKVENTKYSQGIQWLKEVLWSSQFTPERLKIGVAKLANDVPSNKRKGGFIAITTLNDVNFTETSNQYATNLIRQQKFLKSLAKKLEKETTKVCDELKEFREYLCNPKHLRMQVVANLLKLKEPKKALKQFLPSEHSQQNNLELLSPIQNTKDTFRKFNVGQGYIVGISSIESSFLQQSGEGISSFQDPDQASLLVLIEYLTTMEGAFWKQIRGLGLAYGYNINMNIDEGLLYFSLTKSANVTKAYEVSRGIAKDYLAKKLEFEDTMLEAARSGVIFSIVNREETLEKVGEQAFLNYLRKIGPYGNQELLHKVQKVTTDDLYRVLGKYLEPLFHPTNTNVAITANPSKIDEILKGFSAMERNLTLIEKIDKHF